MHVRVGFDSSQLRAGRQVAQVGPHPRAEFDHSARQVGEHRCLAPAHMPIEVAAHGREERRVEPAAQRMRRKPWGATLRTVVGRARGGRHTASGAGGQASKSAVEIPHFQPSGDGCVATYQAAIWARDRKPSRARIRSTWDSAERSVMTSSSAICRFDQPCATNAATWQLARGHGRRCLRGRAAAVQDRGASRSAQKARRRRTGCAYDRPARSVSRRRSRRPAAHPRRAVPPGRPCDE